MFSHASRMFIFSSVYRSRMTSLSANADRFSRIEGHFSFKHCRENAQVRGMPGIEESIIESYHFYC